MQGGASRGSRRHLHPLQIWEAVTEHSLAMESAKKFRRRSECADLRKFPAPTLIVFACLSEQKNPDRNLLLNEWLAAVASAQDLGRTDVEDEVAAALAAESLSSAIALGRDRVATGVLDAEMQRIRSELIDLDERRAASEAQERLAEESRALAAHEQAERSRDLANSRAEKHAEAKRAATQAEREREKEAETSGRAARARADRKRPPVHDMGYEPRPWED